MLMGEANCFCFLLLCEKFEVMCLVVRLAKLRNSKRKDWINTAFSVRKQPRSVLGATCSVGCGGKKREEDVLLKVEQTLFCVQSKGQSQSTGQMLLESKWSLG